MRELTYSLESTHNSCHITGYRLQEEDMFKYCFHMCGCSISLSQGKEYICIRTIAIQYLPSLLLWHGNSWKHSTRMILTTWIWTQIETSVSQRQPAHIRTNSSSITSTSSCPKAGRIVSKSQTSTCTCSLPTFSLKGTCCTSHCHCMISARCTSCAYQLTRETFCRTPRRTCMHVRASCQLLWEY